ncbi:unnamed protein product, partial [Ixodes hexagonus]
IILQNSPLHTYLSDAGFSLSELDLESLDGKDKPQDTPKKSHTSPHVVIIALLANFLQYIWQAFNKSRDAILNQFQAIDTQALIKAITNSPCVEGDDRRFLNSFLEGQPAPATTKEYRVRYVSYFIVTALGACAISRWLKPSPLNSVEASVVRALCCVAMLVVGTVAIKRSLVWHLERSITSLLGTMRDFQSKVKKCLQLIQETEVVARGFTLASHNVPVQRLEMSKFLPSLDPQRQCPELRRSVFMWTRELFLFWRSVTCQYTVPLEGELDASSMYLAFTKPENISHELFTSDSEDLKAGTENFSLSALKASIDPFSSLHIFYISYSRTKFLRRIALCTMPGVTKTLLSNAVAVSKIVNRANSECQQQLRKLSNAYQFYVSSCMPQDEAEDRISRPVRKDLQELHITVHSLALHLRAALKRVQVVESITESLGDETKLGTVESHISRLLAEVKEEVGSSGSCLEEAALLLDKRAGRTPSKENQVVVPSAEPQSVVPVLKITEKDSPVIVDEVFEALLTDKPDVRDVEPDNDFDQNNKVRSSIKQREASAVMFKELRSVLVVKAKEHQEREKNALARSGVEGEHFDKLGFVVPEDECPHETDMQEGMLHEPHKDGLFAETVALDTSAARKDDPRGGEGAESNPCEPFPTREVANDLPENTVTLPAGRFSLPHPSSLAFLAVDRAKQFLPMQTSTFEDDVSGSSSEETQPDDDES